jgi:hypothetical protein
MRRLCFLALSPLVACEPPTPDVNIDFLTIPPMEIDTTQDQCVVAGGKPFAEPFFSEEMCVAISVPLDDWYIEARQVSLDFQDYRVDYLVQNESGDIEPYVNGMQVHLDPEETISVPLRAVGFTQKEQAADFGADELVVKATLTLFSTNRWNDEQIETKANYDIIMTDFNNCSGIPIVTCL